MSNAARRRSRINASRIGSNRAIYKIRSKPGTDIYRSVEEYKNRPTNNGGRIGAQDDAIASRRQAMPNAAVVHVQRNGTAGAGATQAYANRRVPNRGVSYVEFTSNACRGRRHPDAGGLKIKDLAALDIHRLARGEVHAAQAERCACAID